MGVRRRAHAEATLMAAAVRSAMAGTGTESVLT